MKLLWGLLCVVAVACRWHDETNFPASAVPFRPGPEFHVWWEVVESCSGRRARFDDVKWFQTSEFIMFGDEIAFGAWFPGRNRIALLGSDSFHGPIVRHEMLHAILQDGSHPREYFQSKCGDAVACGRDCVHTSLPDDLTQASPIDFDVDLDVFPHVPSISRYAGRMSFVLKVRNRTDRTAFLNSRDFDFAHCQIGILVASVADPDRSVFACDYIGGAGLSRVFLPGEVRSVVVDFALQGGSPDETFVAEPIVIGVVLADNVRRSVALTLRP